MPMLSKVIILICIFSLYVLGVLKLDEHYTKGTYYDPKTRRWKKKYKSFRKQVMECEKSGNLKEEDCCYMCGQKLLICKKYGAICKSSVCRKERGIE